MPHDSVPEFLAFVDNRPVIVAVLTAVLVVAVVMHAAPRPPLAPLAAGAKTLGACPAQCSATGPAVLSPRNPRAIHRQPSDALTCATVNAREADEWRSSVGSVVVVVVVVAFQ